MNFLPSMSITDKVWSDLITSSSLRYMSSQLEKTRSMELSSILSSGDVTSAHMKVMFLWMCPLISSFYTQVSDQISEGPKHIFSSDKKAISPS